MPLPLLHSWALWFQAVIIYVVTFTSTGRKQPEHLILFTTSPKNKLRLHQTSCWLVWTSAWHSVGCLQNTPSPWTVSSYGWVARLFPPRARLVLSWTIPAHFKDQVCCSCVPGGRWREGCHTIFEGLRLGKSSQTFTTPYSLVLPSGEARLRFCSSFQRGKKKSQWKIILNQLGCHPQSSV